MPSFVKFVEHNNFEQRNMKYLTAWSKQQDEFQKKLKQ